MIDVRIVDALTGKAMCITVDDPYELEKVHELVSVHGVLLPERSAKGTVTHAEFNIELGSFDIFVDSRG